MILRIFGHDFHYECENLCRVYFPNEKINIVYDGEGADSKEVVTRCIPVEGGNRIEVYAEIDGRKKELEALVEASENELRDKSELKTAQLIFAALSELTGYTPPWGVLTGVRPSK
ncbi:MAG: coproporphyrinogen dehydrogenase HemZ, partial [Clostridia bacterium]|nr:coproporphyrinogen dehydrogenase HemZ [Clostridia bacterium]